MARNVEIKARVADWEEAHKRAGRIAESGPHRLEQEDVFFRVGHGRLKLRTENGQSEVIYYLRENAAGPRESDYVCLPATDGAATRRILGAIHGERGVVRKVRWLYLVGQTRIHLDRVEGLGDFLELEVVLREGQNVETGQAIAREIMERMGVGRKQLVDFAYVDLAERGE